MMKTIPGIISTALMSSTVLAYQGDDPPAACGATEGSCYEAHGEPGCKCVECCELVCQLDDLCCETPWDEFCVGYAIDLCENLPCDGDGVVDCESEETNDCNGNGILDELEGPTFCPETGRIPVDLIVIKDPSDSIVDVPADKLCRKIFREVAEQLSADFDVRAAWTNILSHGPFDCDDWTMPLGTEVPVCAGEAPRFIDDNISGEEWGDASAVMTRPYQDHLLGQTDAWSERDAVLIIIPISDEGPQNGGEGVAGCRCSEDESQSDGLSMSNLIRQARIENAQILPLVVNGTAACLYDPDDPDSYFKKVATETGGDVVDARGWDPGDNFGDEGTSPQLVAAMKKAVEDVIAASPRIVCEDPCPEDLNDDGQVGGPDLTILLAGWGTDDELADLNGDGEVGGPDLTLLLAKWGDC